MRILVIVTGAFQLICSTLAALVICGFAVYSASAIAQPVQQTVPHNATSKAGSEHEYDVSAQLLETALIRLSEQAGVQLLFDPQIVANISVKSLKGRYSLDKALELMLQNAPLTWRTIGEHTITIEMSKRGHLPEDYLLEPIRIQGVKKDKLDRSRLKWESTVLARMRRNKSYPPLALQNGQEDVVYVRITINRAGHVESSSIIRSQHIETLDQAALDLVQLVNPLPPLPPTIEGDQYSIIVPIDYFIS